MRIGLVIEEFDPRRGGVEQWTSQAVEELAARGHEVHVVARRFAAAAGDMPIIAHPLGDVRGRIAFAEAAERALRPLALDVVHDTGCGSYCDVFQPHGGSRVAAAARNLLLLPPWMRRIKRPVDRLLPRYRQFDALSARQYADDGRIVLALSRRVADDLVRHHDVPRERMRLVYNGVDTERFSPERRERHRDAIRRQLGVAPESTLLLIVAHNFRLKGVSMLLEAMSRWPHARPVDLVVVGGKRPDRFVRVARRRGLGRKVHFVGSVEDTVPYYAAADVYVHPTFYDPCSLVVLEALAAGVPVATTRQNGASELMADGREGVLLDNPADVGEFVQKIEPLLDPSRRERMGRAARRLALRHTFTRNIDELIAVYEEVRAARRRAEDEAVERLTRPFVCRMHGETSPTIPSRVPSSDTGVLS
ncbi:MAG TPA: glycosyltransferase family 4 protein [Thermoguttaceae bacterium]|nr:glycosyltransferase family 4 protein [Thermoguttaceae bacterium]